MCLGHLGGKVSAKYTPAAIVVISAFPSLNRCVQGSVLGRGKGSVNKTGWKNLLSWPSVSPGLLGRGGSERALKSAAGTLVPTGEQQGPSLRLPGVYLSLPKGKEQFG